MGWMKYGKRKMPASVLKYFWGDSLEELNWDKHKNYITQTILEKGDREAVRWLFSMLNKSDLQKSITDLKLSPKSKNFWSVYLS